MEIENPSISDTIALGYPVLKEDICNIAGAADLIAEGEGNIDNQPIAVTEPGPSKYSRPRRLPKEIGYKPNHKPSG